MKKLSILLIIVMVVSLLSFSSVFAQTPAPGSQANVCGYGANDGQVRLGKLYMSPGFNLRTWLKHNPRITFSELVALNPGVALIDGPQASCLIIRIPQG